MDPDRHTVTGEEAAEAGAQPIEYRGELHDFVEFGHQVDQRSRLAVAAL